MKKYHVMFVGMTKNYALRNYQRQVKATSTYEAVKIAREQIEDAVGVGNLEPLRGMEVSQIIERD